MTRIYENCTDRRNNSKYFFPLSCFSSHFTFLPLGDASVCSEKMAAPGEKSFCVLEYHTSKSVVTVQRAFRAKYAKDPPKTRPFVRGVNNLLKQVSVQAESTHFDVRVAST